MEVGGDVEGWRARRRLEGTSKVGGHIEGGPKIANKGMRSL
jgi:hypothetical protein